MGLEKISRRKWVGGVAHALIETLGVDRNFGMQRFSLLYVSAQRQMLKRKECRRKEKLRVRRGKKLRLAKCVSLFVLLQKNSDLSTLR